ncbi:uncharacterized protein LOC134102652 [Sardina pilchardus]|uniref:uncharacterized protein LOC134102652 n=1 Tax=Sardina pilchardus TaxID=27697 RepID=UPI002E150201
MAAMGMTPPEEILKPLPSLIIPYGLKSALKAISHAVLVEEPSNVAEYIAFYCSELLCIRKEHPELSIQDLTTLQRFMKGHFVESCTSLAPRLSDAVIDEIPYAHPVTVASLDTPPPIAPNGSPQYPQTEEDEAEGTLSSVQSAVFLRGPAEKAASNESLVLIQAMRPPSKPMIIVHSDNLPDVIVFQNSDQQSCPSSAHSSVEALKQRPGDSGSQTNVGPVVVVFHKVPSVQDVAQSLNLLEELEEVENLAYAVEVLDSALRAGAADSPPKDQSAPAPELAKREMKPSGDGQSENQTSENTGDEAATETTEKTTLSSEIVNKKSDTQPSVEEVTDSLNHMASLTNENTSSEHVGETAIKTIQFMEPLQIAGEPMLKRTQANPTPAVSIKAVISERDRLMKKILQSTELKKQTDISKSKITGITVSSSTGGCPEHLQKMLEANAGHAKADPSTPGSKRISPDVNSALQSSVDQVWTLYQMSKETGAKQPSSKLSPSQPDNYKSPENSAQLINTPNYVLLNDEDAGRKGNQPSDTSPNTNTERPKSGAQRNWIKHHLQISLLADPFSGAPDCSGPLLYGVTSDQGNMACSPVIVRGVNPTYAASNDVDNLSEGIPSEPTCMHWSIEITVKKTTGQQPPQDPSLKK